jgi:hypothetical protein
MDFFLDKVSPLMEDDLSSLEIGVQDCANLPTLRERLHGKQQDTEQHGDAREP